MDIARILRNAGIIHVYRAAILGALVAVSVFSMAAIKGGEKAESMAIIALGILLGSASSAYERHNASTSVGATVIGSLRGGIIGLIAGAAGWFVLKIAWETLSVENGLLARAVGFGALGAVVGGLGEYLQWRSQERALNGFIGGVLGGAVGGAVLHLLAVSANPAIGIVTASLLMGASIGAGPALVVAVATPFSLTGIPGQPKFDEHWFFHIPTDTYITVGGDIKSGLHIHGLTPKNAYIFRRGRNYFLRANGPNIYADGQLVRPGNDVMLAENMPLQLGPKYRFVFIRTRQEAQQPEIMEDAGYEDVRIG